MRFMSLAGRTFKETYRDPLVISLGVGLPVVLLALFVSIGKNAPLDIFKPVNITPGVIVFSFGFLIMFISTLLSKDRQSAFLTRLLTSPLKSSDFILAYTLPYIPIVLVQIIVGYLTGIAFGAPFTWRIFEAVIILLLVAIACIGLGLIFGSLFTENQVAGFGSITIVIISLFSGAWMDLEAVGGIFKGLGYALPFAHAIEACRAILTDNTDVDLWRHFYWVLGYAVALFSGGLIAFHLKTRPK